MISPIVFSYSTRTGISDSPIVHPLLSKKLFKQSFYRLSLLTFIICLAAATAAGAASVTLKWDPSDQTIDGYRIYKRTEKTTYDYSTPAWQGTATSTTLENLDSGTVYYFVTRAYADTQESPNSNEVSYNTPSPTVTDTAVEGDTTESDTGGTSDLSEPDITVTDSNITDSAGGGTSEGQAVASVTLAWEPTDQTIDGYRVYTRTEGTAYDYSTPAWQGTATSTTLKNLNSGTVYYFVTRAYLNTQESPNSNEASYTPPSPVPPTTDAGTGVEADTDVAVETDTDAVAETDATDSDKDGISDLDETNIYGTDPNSADTDGDGIPDGQEVASGSDPTAAPSEEPAGAKLWIEAEKTTVNAPMVIAEDPEASLQKYIWVPEGSGKGGDATYEFNIDEAGEYQLWGRVLAPDIDSNSFWLSFDGAGNIMWAVPPDGTWKWNKMGPIGVYTFNEGPHTIRVSQRESEIKLDKILISKNKEYTPEGVGKFGPPTADAGVDRYVNSNDPITLDGSASVDPAGPITYYNWAQTSGPTVTLAEATSATPSFIAPEVTASTKLTFSLTISNTEGQSTTDTCQVTVLPMTPTETYTFDFDKDGISDADEIDIYGTNPFSADSDGDGIPDGEEINGGSDPLVADAATEEGVAKIWIEAEDGNINAPMEIGDDPNASEGGYIWTLEGSGNSQGGYGQYKFEIQKAGEYIIWGRVISNSEKSDSFFVSVDGSEDLAWHTRLGGKETWTWDVVSERHYSDLVRDDSNPKLYYLEKGSHVLTIKQRDDGTKIDMLLITNDRTYTPISIDETIVSEQQNIIIEAENCELGMPMQINEDPNASEGSYIWTLEGSGNSQGGYARCKFDIQESGEYIIRGRVISNSEKSDSFFVSIDGSEDLAWHTRLGGKETWTWDVVSERHFSDLVRDDSNPKLYYLEKGSHVLTIKQRDDGTKIDKIMITNANQE